MLGRLASRVAVRVSALVLLLVGVAGGLYLGDTPNTARGMDEARKAGSVFLRASAQLRAAESEARDKAGAEAKSAANKARAAEDTARRNQDQPPKGQPSKPPKPPDPGPIPASCSAYKENRAIGCKVLLEWGFGLDQMPCLDRLWTKESGWSTTATNRSSGAYGIPQALPAEKLAKYGADWRTNPATQVKWGLDYIKGRYSTPCGGWSFFQSHNWY